MILVRMNQRELTTESNRTRLSIMRFLTSQPVDSDRNEEGLPDHPVPVASGHIHLGLHRR